MGRMWMLQKQGKVGILEILVSVRFRKENIVMNNIDSIEIVKQGSISDDVCEWKSASDGEFIQNPHTKRLYSNEPSMKNVYCNTCGKKIKIVGD